MSEAAGPERVTSAEAIEVSVREAQSAVVPRDPVLPRDTGRWAAKVDRLAVEQRDGMRGTNVAGRRLTGPVQGFGKMWQKTYRLSVGDTVSPEQAIATWKAHFPELWPEGNRFAGALTGISPGDVALLDLAIGLSKHKPAVCIVFQRPQISANMKDGRDHDWKSLIDAATAAGRRAVAR